MLKAKMIDSGFNRETGISYATIKTPNGIYTGYSYLQEEDKEYASEFAGCKYAEIKANIKMVKDKIRILKSQLSAFEKFYNNISEGRNFNKRSYEARKMRRKMFELKDEIKNLQALKESMHNVLMEDINKRPTELKKFYNKIS